MFYNLAASYNVHEHLIPILELNGHHWLSSGNGSSFGTAGIEGNDVVNLGSLGVAGHDIVSMSFGLRIPIRKHVTAGVAYEIPLTGRQDLLSQRATMSLLWEY